VAVYAALAGGLGLLTALIASVHGWPVAARVAAGLLPAAAGVVVPWLLTMLYSGMGIESAGHLRRLRLDDPTSSPLYGLFGVAALAGVQGFGAAMGAGWRLGWAGLTVACVAVLLWGLGGAGLIPLPGRARRLSLGSWVRRLRVRYRRRSRQLAVTAVVWWPAHLKYRAVVRVTGGECKAGDSAGRAGGQPPRVERVQQLVPMNKHPGPRWVRQHVDERIDLGDFPACRSLSVEVTTDPPPAKEGRTRVRIQRGPQARPGSEWVAGPSWQAWIRSAREVSRLAEAVVYVAWWLIASSTLAPGKRSLPTCAKASAWMKYRWASRFCVQLRFCL
jgi:hypothetical protein